MAPPWVWQQLLPPGGSTSRIRSANYPNIRQQLQLQPELPPLTAFPLLGQQGKLERGRREPRVALSSTTTPCDDHPLTMSGQIGHESPAATVIPHLCSYGDSHLDVLTVATMLRGPAAIGPRGGGKLPPVAELQESTHTRVRNQRYRAAIPPVSSIRPTRGDILFTPPTDRAIPPASGGYSYAYSINHLRGYTSCIGRRITILVMA